MENTLQEPTRATKLGQYVRRARLAAVEKRPMSALAALAGITPQYWSLIEKGEGPENPSDDLLHGLARALLRPVEELWLVAYEDSMPLGLRERIGLGSLPPPAAGGKGEVEEGPGSPPDPAPDAS